MRLVPPADPKALVGAIRDLARGMAMDRGPEPLYADLRKRIAPRAVGESLTRGLEDLVGGAKPVGSPML